MLQLRNLRVRAVRSYGKQFLLDFGNFVIRIHLPMFGSRRIDKRKETARRLSLEFECGELNFYSCAMRLLEGKVADPCDWRRDVMSDEWNPALARKQLSANPDTLVCDAPLDQDIFAGVGNIINTEVIYCIGVHPLSNVGAQPARKLRELVEPTRVRGFQFLEWKRLMCSASIGSRTIAPAAPGTTSR
ncbi:MAG: endonuclease [Rhodanobacter sp.]